MPAPDFVLPSIRDAPVSLAGLRAAGPVVLWLAAEAEVDSELAQRGYGEAREQPGL